jgi:predicted flap endonuclease-1-like 5' DNA nuclease
VTAPQPATTPLTADEPQTATTPDSPAALEATKAPEFAAATAPEVVTMPDVVAVPDVVSVSTAGTVPDAVDDLVRIDGIGPKMAQALNAAGIASFADLAATDEATLRAAIRTAGMRFAPSLGTWSSQARALAGDAPAGGPGIAQP